MKTEKRDPPKTARKRLRLKGFDYSDPGHVYFLTICAREGTAPFVNKDLSAKIVSSLDFYRKEKGVRLYCYCVMPNHLHLVMSPSQGFSVSDFVKGLKTFTAKAAERENQLDGKLWQKSFYDHIVRKDESLVRICEYVLANPVRKKLIAKPEDWRFSGTPDPLPV